MQEGSYQMIHPQEKPMAHTAEQHVGHRHTVIITPTERLDTLTAPRFRRQFEEHLGAGTTHFIVDLSVTPSMDGAGLAALVSLFTRARRAGGTVTLIRSHAPAIERMLRLTQLDHFFDVVEQAYSPLQKPHR
jgi:anti-sigma B factor antagonist